MAATTVAFLGLVRAWWVLAGRDAGSATPCETLRRMNKATFADVAPLGQPDAPEDER